MSPDPLSRAQRLLRGGLILSIVTGLALALAFVSGALTPERPTAARVVDAFEHQGGLHPGYRRNHAKGVCVRGHFAGNGALADASRAAVFAAGETPVVGRFAIAGPHPRAPDGSAPVRSLALEFRLADGQRWRTGMNNMPVFPVATPQDFYALLAAQRPDPQTGRPDPARMGAFFAAHPEAGGFLAWAQATAPSASYASQSYHALNAFHLVDAHGRERPVRWWLQAQSADDGARGDSLQADLMQRLTDGPLHWRLMVRFAADDDAVDDATQVWPDTRRTVDAGTLVLQAAEDQRIGACRDINFDPTVLPDGIRVSADPLLAARSSAYAASYRRRTREGVGSTLTERPS